MLRERPSLGMRGLEFVRKQEKVEKNRQQILLLDMFCFFSLLVLDVMLFIKSYQVHSFLVYFVCFFY